MQEHRDSRDGGSVVDGATPDLDLVEYVVVSVPELSATVGVASAIRELVESAQIRILDLVGVVTSPDGRFTAVEAELLSGLAELRSVEGEVGGLLSQDDIALACRGLQPGTSALILVVEDRWAQVLADAARHSGGRIIGGERIPRHRLEQAQRSRTGGPERRRPVVKRVASSRRSHVDLLRRRPLLDPVVGVSPASAAVSRVVQLRVLLHLVERGVLSAEELELQQDTLSRRPPPT